jgi:SNF2 family DNA or RNA helicase
MSRRAKADIKAPLFQNWRTTGPDEINRRARRARTKNFRITNADPRHPIFSNFHVESGSDLTHSVEIRDIGDRQFACDCMDFRINGLGTCKHVEAVLVWLGARLKNRFRQPEWHGASRLDVVLDGSNDQIRLSKNGSGVPIILRSWFDGQGRHCGSSIERTIESLREISSHIPELRLSQELDPWLQARNRAAERKELRREYELKVQRGEWPTHETKVHLFPYQREGMLHLAFTERALLADEMGLGRAIQAIAACALLHRLGKAKRVLVVTPASLKNEWAEQIQRFTDLSYQRVFGGPAQRRKAYDAAAPHASNGASLAPFFTIVDYEQMLADAPDINQRLQPDIVILNEAQWIKNWSARMTQALKRLRSRYAFALTCALIENRIDELFSVMAFLQPALLGPRFRFNREYYELDDHGRPTGYRNLDKLRERVKPYLLRRRKVDVETELPERTDRNYFVPLSEEQKHEYESHNRVLARLASTAKRCPFNRQQRGKILRHLDAMRMVCDTNYILDPEQRACPKLAELEKILEECAANPETKIAIFSEWERMLELVKNVCDRLELAFAWHTGMSPQKRRCAEIDVFKSDPNCRVFLSTDSGAAGLSLQDASVVINCDVPWNPAKLQQRIACARKHQARALTVINLVSENTIEQRILETLANKQALTGDVLDIKDDLKNSKLQNRGQTVLEKLAALAG